MVRLHPGSTRKAVGRLVLVVMAVGAAVLLPTTRAAATGTAQPLCSTPQPGHFRCAGLALPRPNSPATSSNNQQGFQAADIEALYGTTALAGIAPTSSAPVVAIVDAYGYPSPGAEADLATYRSQNALPTCTTANGCFARYDQTGGNNTPPPDAGWAEETALDLDAVSAACPACRIALVQADSSSDQDLMTAVSTATRLGARYVSMSWGAPEDGMTAGAAAAIDKAYFATPGVTYAAATGDDGYAPGPNYPATSPNVVAVGGVDVEPGSAAGTYLSTAWGYVDAGTWVGAGSGCSAIENAPSALKRTTSSACGARRATSDVSAMAGSQTKPFRIIFEGREAFVGGTSQATPIIAALYAATGESTGSLKGAVQAYAFTNAGGLADITAGSTGNCSPAALCTAGSGWDGPTGIGEPTSPASLAAAAPGGVSVTNPGKQTSYLGAAVDMSVTATYSGALSAASGAMTYAATGLPTGLKLSGAGRISGTVTKAGTFAVSLSARNKVAAGTAKFSWTVRRGSLVPSKAPMIVGTVAVGHTVRVSSFAWKSASGATVSPNVHYQWYLGGKPIKGATKSSFTIPNSAAYRKKSLTVRITVKASKSFAAFSANTSATPKIV